MIDDKAKGATMVTIDYLKEFIMLAETLNFTQAAEKLYLTVPALSRHISSLEKALGTSLFKRTTREVQLTEVGTVALRTFRAMIDEWSNFEETVSALAGTPSQTLTLFTHNGWLQSYIEPIVVSEAWKEAGITLSVEVHHPFESLKSLSRKECDLYLGVAQPFQLNDDIELVYFLEEPLVVLMKSSDPLVSRAFVSLAGLEGRPIVFLSDENGGYNEVNDWHRRLFKSHGVEIGASYYVSQLEAAPVVICETDAVCLAPLGVTTVLSPLLHCARLVEADAIVPLGFYHRKSDTSCALDQFLRVSKTFAESLELGSAVETHG